MPWHGDQFDYTKGYVRLLMDTFFERREEVRRENRDPFRSGAMPYYDLLRAFDEITLTHKQWEAFGLRLCGFSYREIGQILGRDPMVIYRRIGWVEKKIIGYLSNQGATPPPPTGVVSGGI